MDEHNANSWEQDIKPLLIILAGSVTIWWDVNGVIYLTVCQNQPCQWVALGL